MSKTQPDIVVVDDYLDGPDQWRDLALAQTYWKDEAWYKGVRTKERFWDSMFDADFCKLLRRTITNADYPTNGVFQICNAQDPVVYHYDLQQWAGALYLTPNAPAGSGTSFYRSKHTGERLGDRNDSSFSGGFYDPHQFELIDRIGNVYNRLVLWNAKLIHAGGPYFGTNEENSRLFQIFFFDAE